MPTCNHNQKYEAPQQFKNYEHGLDTNPKVPDVLKSGVRKKNLTPTMGSEISGIQISSLTDNGKDRLTLLIAQRMILAFRGQDFADLPVRKALENGGYSGKHYVRPISGK